MGRRRFEVLFLLQPQGTEVATSDAEVEAFPVVGTQAQDFPLVLDLVEAGGGLVGTFSYNQALFDSTTALRWRGHLEALLAGAAADPARPLTELPLLSEGERHQVTFEWGEAVHVDGGPAPIGIWGELAGAPAGRRARRLADGTLEVSAPAPAGLAEPAEARPRPPSRPPRRSRRGGPPSRPGASIPSRPPNGSSSRSASAARGESSRRRSLPPKDRGDVVLTAWPSRELIVAGRQQLRAPNKTGCRPNGHHLRAA